jgi:hypothetical protein
MKQAPMAMMSAQKVKANKKPASSVETRLDYVVSLLFN